MVISRLFRAHKGMFDWATRGEPIVRLQEMNGFHHNRDDDDQGPSEHEPPIFFQLFTNAHLLTLSRDGTNSLHFCAGMFECRALAVIRTKFILLRICWNGTFSIINPSTGLAIGAEKCAQPGDPALPAFYWSRDVQKWEIVRGQ